MHLTFRESPTPIRCWCHAEWTQHLTKNRGHNPTRDAHGATGILSCNMWVLFWTKKMGSHRMLLEMNIFVRSSKGQSRYPLITTVLLQKMIFSSYFEDGSWNTLPIGLGACEPRWRIGWFEGKVFVLRQICRQKSSLPSMLSYFSFYTTGIHSWKAWMSPTFPLKSGDSIHISYNFTYKQSHLLTDHLIRLEWSPFDRLGLPSPPKASQPGIHEISMALVYQ